MPREPVDHPPPIHAEVRTQERAGWIEILDENLVRVHDGAGRRADVTGKVKSGRFLAVVRAALSREQEGLSPEPVRWDDILKQEHAAAGDEMARRLRVQETPSTASAGGRRAGEVLDRRFRDPKTPRSVQSTDRLRRDGLRIRDDLMRGNMPGGWWSSDKHGACWTGPTTIRE
jgi:hypothetical protein